MSEVSEILGGLREDVIALRTQMNGVLEHVKLIDKHLHHGNGRDSVMVRLSRLEEIAEHQDRALDATRKAGVRGRRAIVALGASVAGAAGLELWSALGF